jgi:hypothetical protein
VLHQQHLTAPARLSPANRLGETLGGSLSHPLVWRVIAADSDTGDAVVEGR